MKINVIIIGDEILIGQVTDINTAEIARQIEPYGWKINRATVVGDNPEAIEYAVREALVDADVVITTGGLGPTKDDLTKEVFCRITGGTLYENDEVLQNVISIMNERHIELNQLTRLQAMIPDTCTPVTNTCGTAPGMWFDIDDGSKVIIAMPGVPFETAEMLSRSIVPMLVERFEPGDTICHRSLILSGISESAVAEAIADWEAALPSFAHLAYLPDAGFLRLRLDIRHSDPAVANATADNLLRELKGMLSDFVIVDRDLSPAEMLLSLLIENNLTVASAESCTGGNIAHSLTMIPGSSAAVKGGIVAYCNSIKESLLNVQAETLRAFGAVSEPTVIEMARGAQRAMQCSIAIATSGIAGPSGAVEGKPVGTVCIAVALPDGSVVAATHRFPGNRLRVIQRSTNTALILAFTLLRRYIADLINNH